MNIYEHRNVSVSYDRELEIVCLKWQGFCPGSIFREVIRETLEFMKNRSVSRMLSDITGQRVVSPASQETAGAAVQDFIRKGNVLRIAVVSTEKSVARACAERFVMLVKENNTDRFIRFFEEKEDALCWLAE